MNPNSPVIPTSLTENTMFYGLTKFELTALVSLHAILSNPQFSGASVEARVEAAIKHAQIFVERMPNP